MKPVDLILRFFGGNNATAKALGLTPSAVSQWKHYGKGQIPPTAWRSILKASDKLGLGIVPADLMFGRNKNIPRLGDIKKGLKPRA